MSRRRLVPLSLGLLPCALLALVALVACNGQGAATAVPAATPTPTPALRGSGDALFILYWQPPGTLNPHLTFAQPDRDASRLTYEPLASYDKNGNLIPILAASIPSRANGDLAADGMSVTWRLLPGVKWSDGEPFSAADVVFTYEFITNPQAGSSSIGAYRSVANVEAVDDVTVKVTFWAPNPSWALPFVGLQGLILPQHVFQNYVGAAARTAPANTAPVGTGPYRVIIFRQREEVLLLGTTLLQTNRVIYEPNPYYRDPNLPYFRRVELKGGATVNEAARMALQGGDYDYAWNTQISTDLIDQLETLGTGVVITNPSPRVERIVLNLTDPRQVTAQGERSSLQYPSPFFADKQVRQAIAYAIDRQAIAALYPGGRAVDNLLVAPPVYVTQDVTYGYDPGKAAAMLDGAGWVDSNGNGTRDKNGVEMQLVFQTSDDPTRQQVMQIVQKSLQAIGVGVTLRQIPAPLFFNGDPNNPNTLERFQADVTEYSRGNEFPDPGSYMALWTCSQIPQQSNRWTGQNIARWCNPAYDALYTQSTTELDPAQRQQLFAQMNQMLVEDVVVIPLLQTAQLASANKNLAGIDPTPWDGDPWNISEWRRSRP